MLSTMMFGTMFSQMTVPSFARHAAVALVASTTVAGATGCETTQELYETDRAAVFMSQPGAALEVDTFNGAVRIERGGQEQIEISAKIRSTTQERLAATQVSVDYGSDNVVRIGVDWPIGMREKRESCSFVILVPQASGVDVETSNGRIEVMGMAGDAKVRTSNGRIEVKDHDGPVDAKTSNGRITVTDANGLVHARTSNGRITVTRPGGPVDVETSNGAITLTVPSDFGGVITCDTSNGSIKGDMPTHATVIKSGKGYMQADLGEGHGAKLNTSNGSITLNFE